MSFRYSSSNIAHFSLIFLSDSHTITSRHSIYGLETSHSLLLAAHNSARRHAIVCRAVGNIVILNLDRRPTEPCLCLVVSLSEWLCCSTVHNYCGTTKTRGYNGLCWVSKDEWLQFCMLTILHFLHFYVQTNSILFTHAVALHMHSIEGWFTPVFHHKWIYKAYLCTDIKTHTLHTEASVLT